MVYLSGAFLCVVVGGLQSLAAAMCPPAQRYDWLRQVREIVWLNVPELLTWPAFARWEFRSLKGKRPCILRLPTS